VRDERTPRREVLLTGASGFLGKVVLYELLRRREALGVERLYVLLRARDGRGAGARLREEVLASPCLATLGGAGAGLVEAVEGDCEQPGCGLAPETAAALRARVTHVIHCAASIDFDLPIARAASANAASALEVLELARGCAGLARLVDVSTAYVTPHPGDGVEIEERLAPLPRDPDRLYEAVRAGRYDDPEALRALLAETGHPNTYTLTKSLAEHLLARRRGGVPLVFVRPSIIAAAHRRPFPGWIDSSAGFALFAIGIGSGRMQAVMARPASRLDLVPVDAVAERVVDAAFGELGSRGAGAPELPIVHAVAGFSRSATLRLARERVNAFFACHPPPGGPPPRVRYLGPDGARWRRWHRRVHERRPASAPLAARIEDTNRRFAYFTHRSFRFRSSAPLDDPGFDPARYLDVVCRGVWRHLLGGDERAVPLAGRDHPREARVRWALAQPRAGALARAAAWAVDAALARACERVTLDEASLRAALAAVPRDALVVLAPSHRSYLDFVLVSYLCFARPDLGLPLPRVAAASEFARLPVLGRVLAGLGAFYLERGRGREDKRLTEVVDRLVRERAVLEFFVEGRRSRSRRFVEPRRGLLRSLQATGQPCALLPLAIAYERVPEEAGFVAELGGAPKPPMRVRDLLAWTGRLARGEIELGRVHVACGAPIRLDLETDVHAVSRALVAQLQARMAATGYHLRAFLASAALPGVDEAWLAAAIAARGGHVLEGSSAPAPACPVLARCLREHVAPHFHAEAALAYAGNPGVEHHLRANAWAPPGPRDAEAALADARVRAVVRALFDPVRLGRAAAARALARAAEPLPAPAELVRSLPEAHLPDVEELYEDLAERGILARGDAQGGWRRGPRARELAAYADACAATGAEEA